MIVDLKRAIRQLVRETLSMPENSVRPAEQTGPVPVSGVWATAKITMLDTEGWDEQELKTNQIDPLVVDHIIKGQRRVLASLQFYRAGAYQLAQSLQALLQSTTAVSKMNAVGLGLISVEQAEDITQLVDSQWEERAVVNVEFYCISKVVVETGTYGVFPIGINYDGRLTVELEVNEP